MGIKKMTIKSVLIRKVGDSFVVTIPKSIIKNLSDAEKVDVNFFYRKGKPIIELIPIIENELEEDTNGE